MKRTLTFLILTAFAATPAFAGTVEHFKGGMKDIISSPLEIRDSVKTETSRKDAFMPFALVGGTLKGGFYMAKKVTTGTYHVVTSPLEMLKK